MLKQKFLKITSSKSKKYLKWKPTFDIKKAVKVTSDWYLRVEKKNEDPIKITSQQINDYMLKN